MFENDLDARISELEKALAKTTPGSAEYEHIVEDHGKLVKAKLDLHRSERQDILDEKDEAFKEKEADRRHEENLKKLEVEENKGSIKKDLLTIVASTIVPMGMLMLFEKSGNILSGLKPSNFVGKKFF